VCWEDGHGWAELAAFLGFDIPDLAFPHRNRSNENEIDIHIDENTKKPIGSP
jgi:hypothetical protein